MAKRYIAFFLALILLASSFTACTQSNDTQQETTAETTTAKPTDDTSFKLSYTQGDSLDPFEAKTQNNQILSDLVFESLFDLDENYEPVTNIATGYEFTDSKTLSVTIDPQIKFSDGSSLDSDDVVYSFNAAKDSPAYGNSLEYISAACASGNTVTFYLSHETP